MENTYNYPRNDKAKLEVADIFLLYGEKYGLTNSLSYEPIKAMIISKYAAAPNSVFMWSNTLNAVSSGSLTTHAGIDIARNCRV